MDTLQNADSPIGNEKYKRAILDISQCIDRLHENKRQLKIIYSIKQGLKKLSIISPYSFSKINTIIHTHNMFSLEHFCVPYYLLFPRVYSFLCFLFFLIIFNSCIVLFQSSHVIATHKVVTFVIMAISIAFLTLSTLYYFITTQRHFTLFSYLFVVQFLITLIFPEYLSSVFLFLVILFLLSFILTFYSVKKLLGDVVFFEKALGDESIIRRNENAFLQNREAKSQEIKASFEDEKNGPSKSEKTPEKLENDFEKENESKKLKKEKETSDLKDNEKIKE